MNSNKDNFLQKIFSVKNVNRHKVVELLGLKIKFKKKINFNDLIEQQNKLREQQNEIIKILCDNFTQFYWRTRLMNIGISHIFQYMTGIELNNDFVMEREILFDPTRAPVDHYNRYAFAVENITENDKVADIACTCGYGTSMLAKKAKKVIGIDINQSVINFANKVYKKDNIEFYCQDAQSFTINEELDAVVSFETIEHIEHPKMFLNKVNSLLKVGGKIICSVPNETVRPWANEGNNFHYRHYTKDEIKELLNNCGFEIDKIYQQYDEDGYKIEQKDKEGLMLVVIARKSS